VSAKTERAVVRAAMANYREWRRNHPVSHDFVIARNMSEKNVPVDLLHQATRYLTGEVSTAPSFAWLERWRAMLAAAPDLREENKRLRAEIAASRLDAERLDFLQNIAGPGTAIDIYATFTEIQVADSYPGDGTHTLSKEPTLRAAIDKAREWR